MKKWALSILAILLPIVCLGQYSGGGYDLSPTRAWVSNYVEAAVAAGGGTNTLAEVLTAGNDAGGSNVLNLGSLTINGLNKIDFPAGEIRDENTGSRLYIITDSGNDLDLEATDSRIVLRGDYVELDTGTYLNGGGNYATNLAHLYLNAGMTLNMGGAYWVGDGTSLYVYDQGDNEAFAVADNTRTIFFGDGNTAITIGDASGIEFKNLPTVNGTNVLISYTETDPIWSSESNLYYLASNPTGYITEPPVDNTTTTNMTNTVSFPNGIYIAGSLLDSVGSEEDPVFTNWLDTNAYVQVETDPIWSAESNLYYLASNPSGYLTAETDPIFNATSNSIGYLSLSNVWDATNSFPAIIVNGTLIDGSTNAISIADVTFDADFIPDTSNAYDIGSAAFPVKDIYVNTGTVYFVGESTVALTVDTNGQISTAVGTNAAVASVKVGDNVSDLVNDAGYLTSATPPATNTTTIEMTNIVSFPHPDGIKVDEVLAYTGNRWIDVENARLEDNSGEALDWNQRILRDEGATVWTVEGTADAGEEIVNYQTMTSYVDTAMSDIYHAQMCATNGHTVNLTGVGTNNSKVVTVTNQFVSTNAFTSTSSNLTVKAAGTGLYHATVSASFSTAAAEDMHGHLFLNGVAQPSLGWRRTLANNSWGAVSAQGFLNLTTNDVVTYRIYLDSTGSSPADATFHSACLTLHKINGN